MDVDPQEYDLTTYDDPARLVVPSSEVRLVERLLARVPGLRQSYDEHIADNDSVMPHVYFGDVTRWTVTDYEADSAGKSGGWREVLAFLEQEYDHSGYDAQAVIEQSFVENLPHPGEPAAGIVQQLGPKLKAIYDSQRGLT